MINIKFDEVVEKFRQLTTVNKRVIDVAYSESILSFGTIRDTVVDGVYYIKIGNPTVLYTAHYDTAGDSTVTLESKENMPHIMYNKGKGILGADDKSGLTVLLFMIQHKIEGLYVFFGDEESGASQSKTWIDSGWEERYGISTNSIKAAIAFDRKGYSDIIQTQRNKICCSMKYAEVLSSIFSMGGFNYRPSDGLYTDTANMIYKIPECTNISIGYFNQHTDKEEQDMLFLWRMVNFMVNNHKSISEIPAFKEVEIYKPYVPTKVFGHRYYSTGDVEVSNGDWYSLYNNKKKDIPNMIYLVKVGTKHPLYDCLDECYNLFEEVIESDLLYENMGEKFLHLNKSNFEYFELDFVSLITNINSKQTSFKIDCYKFLATVLSAVNYDLDVYISLLQSSFNDNFDIKYSEAFNGHIFTNQFDDFIEASNGFNEELHQIDGYTEELPEFVY